MNTEIQTGTIFRFNSIHARWKDKVPINTLMVADVLEDGETRHFRALAKDQPGCQGQLLNFWFDEPDDITIVGQLPPDQLNNATEWKEEFAIKQPMKFKDLKPGTVFQFTTKPDWWRNTISSWKQPMVAMGNCWRYLDTPVVVSQTHDDLEVLGQLTGGVGDLQTGKEWSPTTGQFPLGMRFRFKSLPDRWGQKLPPDTFFHVVEYGDFDGVGQAIQREESTIPWCSSDGVVFADDIEIVATAEQKPAQAAQAEEKPEELPLGTKFRFRSFPDRWNSGSVSVTSHTVFEVVNEEFTGEGQCIRATDRQGARWGTDDGVLPSDDIDIAE